MSRGFCGMLGQWSIGVPERLRLEPIAPKLQPSSNDIHNHEPTNHAPVLTTGDNYDDVPDEQLMTLIKAQDNRAFEALYDRYKNRLLLYFHRMLGRDEELAQDFLQEIFLKIIEKPHYFSGKSSFSTWIFTIAGNMVKNEYRRQGVCKIMEREDDLDIFASPNDEEMVFDHAEFKRKVMEELDSIDRDRRSTFLLRFQEGLSLQEISDIQGCSLGTVKSRLFYTSKYLAARLKAFAPTNS